jgi:hypothetical protein
MSVTTTQYIRKPLFVAAVRVTGANFDEIASWCQGEEQQDEMPDGTGKKFIRVRVHNPKNPRQTKAFVGDWLLYTERGYKVYTNKAFHASFDEVYPEPVANGKTRKDYVMGLEEILPDVTLNEVIAWLRDQPALSLDQIRELVKSGETFSVSRQSIEETA